MKLFLNVSSSAVMLFLMALLCLVALQDLCGVKMPRFLPAERPQTAKSCRPWEPWAAAFGGLALLWGLCFLSWLFQDWKGDGFLPLFYERFTVAGDAPHYLWLAETALLADLGSIQTVTLPGAARNFPGGSYYVLDPALAAQTVNTYCNPYQTEITTEHLTIRQG